jgi:hypothetical protein
VSTCPVRISAQARAPTTRGKHRELLAQREILEHEIGTAAERDAESVKHERDGAEHSVAEPYVGEGERSIIPARTNSGEAQGRDGTKVVLRQPKKGVLPR